MSLGIKSDHKNPTIPLRGEKSRVRRWYIHKGTLDSCKTVEIAASLRFLIHFLVTMIVVVIFLSIITFIAALVKRVERDEIVTKLRLLNCGRLNIVSTRDGGNRFRALRSRRR